MKIRKMQKDDAEKYRDLRLLALKESPAAFGSSYEENREKDLKIYYQRIPKPDDEDVVLVAESDDGQFMGMVGFLRIPRVKMRHKGSIYGVYVKPEARGQGIARALMEDALAHIRQVKGLRFVTLSVVTTNTPAKNLYESLGFEIWGTEPEVLYVEGTYYDEHHMILRL